MQKACDKANNCHQIKHTNYICRSESCTQWIFNSYKFNILHLLNIQNMYTTWSVLSHLRHVEIFLLTHLPLTAHSNISYIKNKSYILSTCSYTYGSISILIVVMPLGSRCLLSAALTETSNKQFTL